MHRTDTTYGLQTCRRLGFAAIMLFLALPMHILHAAGAEQDTADDVMKILKSEALENTVTGVLVISAGGDTLVACNPDKNMVPASNLKLVTTGTAIDFLGSGYRFRTSLAYSGHITGGVLHGDLYIIGGGDPTLAADDSIALPAEAVFSQWKSYVEKAGISKIEGRIIGDSRYFDSVAEEDTWVWNDIGTYYGTGTSGLSFYENKKDFLVEAGENVAGHFLFRNPTTRFGEGVEGAEYRVYALGTPISPSPEQHRKALQDPEFGLIGTRAVGVHKLFWYRRGAPGMKPSAPQKARWPRKVHRGIGYEREGMDAEMAEDLLLSGSSIAIRYA